MKSTKTFQMPKILSDYGFKDVSHYSFHWRYSYEYKDHHSLIFIATPYFGNEYHKPLEWHIKIITKSYYYTEEKSGWLKYFGWPVINLIQHEKTNNIVGFVLDKLDKKQLDTIISARLW